MAMGTASRTALVLALLALVASVWVTSTYIRGNDAGSQAETDAGDETAPGSDVPMGEAVTHGNQRWKGGLYMGTKQSTHSKGFKVMMNDGAGYHSIELLLRTRFCEETVTGYAIKKTKSKILHPKKDVTVTYERLDGETEQLENWCRQYTYNITTEASFENFPGQTNFNVVVYTKLGGKKRAYTFSTNYRAIGLVLYSGNKIYSGDNHPMKKLGDYKKINRQQLFSMNVEAQAARDLPQAKNIEMRLYDPNCDSWPEYVNWDSSCPPAYLNRNMNLKKQIDDNFGEEGGKCNIAFSSDMKRLFFKMNENRVGCGQFCVDIMWKGMNYRGIEFHTSFCFEIDTTPAPPATVDCVDMNPDYYGGETFQFNAFNLERVQGDMPQGTVPAAFKMGEMTWDVTSVQMAPVNQLVTVRASSLEQNASSSSTFEVDSGAFVFERPDGSSYEVEARVVCGSAQAVDKDDKLKVMYQSPLLAEAEQAVRPGDGMETLEVQIYTPLVGRMSAARVAKYMTALPLADGKLVGVRSQSSGSEIKLHYSVDSLDVYEVVDRIQAQADAFAARVGGLDAQISHVGEPTESFRTLDTN